MLRTIFLLAGLFILSQKQVKISSTRTIEGRAVQRMALLFILPSLLSFYTYIAPKSLLTEVLVNVTLAGYALAILVTIYLVAFHKPGQQHASHQDQSNTPSGKTLAHLNSTARYRLLKVIFGLFFLLALVIANVAVIDNGVKMLDQDKTTISCKIGNMKVFTPNQASISLSNYALRDGFDYNSFTESNSYDTDKILDECARVSTLPSGFKPIGTLFEIAPVYTYAYFVLYLIIGNISVLLGFEVLRRIYYYIVLGVVFPVR